MPASHLTPLRLGEIDYLNVSPLFSFIKRHLPHPSPVSIVRGHPSTLNVLLSQNKLDLAPASSFEYLARPDRYRLLAGHSISADGPVKSVLLLSPVPRNDLAELIRHDPTLLLSPASASSVALLRILWRLAWELPEPSWNLRRDTAPDAPSIPTLEIGDRALKAHITASPSVHRIDLAEEWRRFTGLPFVFAVWIVNRGMAPHTMPILRQVADLLETARHRLADDPLARAREVDLPAWLTARDAAEYWQCMNYGLGPREIAGLVLFGKYCTELGLLGGMPQLCWTDPAAI